MAVSIAVLDSGADTTDATSKASASVTLTANRLYLAFFSNVTGTNPPSTATCASANVTFTQIATVGYRNPVSPVRRITAFRALPVATFAGETVTFSCGATQTGFVYVILEVTGMDVSGANGAGAIVQSATNAEDAQTSGTVTLAAFGSTDNATVGFMAKADADEAITVGTGFTELTDAGHATPAHRGQSQWRVDNDTTVTWSWATSSDWGGVALELRAAGTGTGALLGAFRNRLVIS